MQALNDELKISAGDVTADGMFSLEVVRCLGLCASAPLMTVDGELHAKLTPDKVKGILETYRTKAGDTHKQGDVHE